MPIETIIGGWVATGLTLFIFSFLYKDNPLFKLAENLYVGVSVGYTIVKTYDTVIVHLSLEADCRERGMGVVDSGRDRDAHAHAVCAEGRVDLAIRVRLYRGGGVGAGDSTNDLFLYLEADRGYGSPALDVGTGRRGVSFTWSLLNPASSLNAIIILIGVLGALLLLSFRSSIRGQARRSRAPGSCS